jgi:microcystin-dependent protein
MSEIKVDSIRTYTTNANGIAIPNGLYVGNNLIRPNNTIQSTDFTSTNIGGAGYAVPLTNNSMTSKGYVDNLVNSLLNTAGLSGVSKAYVDTEVASAQSNAQTYADNNFMDKNGNTEHTGGGLTFSGGPYTFAPGSSTPIQIKSSLPAILFNETDVTNASGSIGVDGGVFKLVYGNSLSSNTKGLLVDSSGNVNVSTGNVNVSTGTVTAITFIGNGTIPIGGIVMWSGTSIPSGWALCNGQNNTPDLRDRFVIGSANLYAVGASGGSKDAIVVSHNHTATSLVTDPGHTHGVNNVAVEYTGGVGGNNTNLGPANLNLTTTNNTTGITVTTTIGSTGSSATNANLPPYYALAFIMRTV